MKAMKANQGSGPNQIGDFGRIHTKVFNYRMRAFVVLALTTLAAPSAGAAVKAVPAAQGETIQITAGKTVTRHYDPHPQRKIRSVRLVSAKSGKSVPRRWAKVSVATKRRHIEVTIATTTAIPPGDYRLQLLDAKHRPIASGGHPIAIMVRVSQGGNNRAVAPPSLERTGPKERGTARGRMMVGGQGESKATDKRRRTDTTTAKPQSRIRDAIRGERGGEGVRERIEQIGGTSRVGSQLLFGFGQTVRDTITAQLGGWPTGEWQGVLGADISTLRDRSTSGSAKTPTRPDKNASDITRGFRPDARLMSGEDDGGNSGGDDGGDKGNGSSDGSDKDKTDSADDGSKTDSGSDGSNKDKKDSNDDDRIDNITTSDSDEESSDGSSTQSSTVKNNSSDGSTFIHTVSSTKDKNGNRTDTQSVDYKDRNGNQTSYRSSTSGGKTTTRCSGHLCTPHPDSAECSGPGCEAFRAFVQGFVHLSETYGIRSKQRDRESAMQPDGPGSGKHRAGFERPSPKDVIKQRTSRHILPTDGEGTSQGTGVSGPGARPRQDPDTLVNPPEPGRGSGTPGNPEGK